MLVVGCSERVIGLSSSVTCFVKLNLLLRRGLPGPLVETGSRSIEGPGTTECSWTGGGSDIPLGSEFRLREVLVRSYCATGDSSG